MLHDLTKIDVEAEIAKFNSIKIIGSKILISPFIIRSFKYSELSEPFDLHIGLVVGICDFIKSCKVGQWVAYNYTEMCSSIIVNDHLANLISDNVRLIQFRDKK